MEAKNPTELNSQTNLFACDLCPKKYAIIMRFNRHKNDHMNGKIRTTGEQDWNCEQCGKSGRGYRSNKKHEFTHKDPDKKCNVCGKKFRSEILLLKHQRTHTDEGNKCNFCGKWFESLTNLRVHEFIHTDEKPFSCPLCPKKFTQSGALKIHKRTHSDELRYPCSICDKSFKSGAILNEHKENHQKEKDFKCNICSFETHNRGTLYSHKRKIHSKSKLTLSNCDQCGLGFTSNKSMNKHKNIVHNGQLKFSCKQCNFKTGYGDSLKSHVESIHDKIRKSCTICSWKGNGKNLVKHKREMHFKPNNEHFKCDICRKEYSRNDHLKTHKDRDHFGIRYPCPNCEFSSTSKGSLKIHISSKHEGKRYPCKQCEHKAYCSSSLMKHINVIHLNLKPNICNFCEFKAASKSNLKIHQKHFHAHFVLP